MNMLTRRQFGQAVIAAAVAAALPSRLIHPAETHDGPDLSFKFSGEELTTWWDGSDVIWRGEGGWHEFKANSSGVFVDGKRVRGPLPFEAVPSTVIMA